MRRFDERLALWATIGCVMRRTKKNSGPVFTGPPLHST